MTPTANLRDLFSKHWGLLCSRGLASMVFGLVALTWPHLTVDVLLDLFGIYAFANGTLSILLGAQAREESRRANMLLFEGLLSFLAGLITFNWPDVTATNLLFLIGGWAIAGGLTEISVAIKLRRVSDTEWLLALAGLISIAFGGFFLLQPTAGALVLIGWIALWAIAPGLLLIVLAFRMRAFGQRRRTLRT